MKNQNNKSTAFAAAVVVAFAAAPADAANIGRNLPGSCQSLSQIVKIATLIPNYVSPYSAGRKNIMAIGQLRTL
jgi:hypothetical protein